MIKEADFSNLLRKQRMALGLSQEVIAERLGVTARTISNLENGQGKLLEKLCNIGKAYKIDTWLEIFSDEMEKGIEAPKLRAEISKMMSDIPPEYRKLVYVLIDELAKVLQNQ